MEKKVDVHYFFFPWVGAYTIIRYQIIRNYLPQEAKQKLKKQKNNKKYYLKRLIKLLFLFNV